MSLGQLNLSPLMVLMLLLYGLLIALVLVIWSALNLRRQKVRSEQPVATAVPDTTPPTRPAAASAPARTAAAEPERPRPAAVTRRAADSDSVVSYSVRPRLNPAAAQQPAKQPDNPPVRPREPLKDPEIDFQVGRRSRQPSGQTPTTVTPVRQPDSSPAAHGTAPASPARKRSEDAFERFLRSSRDDNDDY